MEAANQVFRAIAGALSSALHLVVLVLWFPLASMVHATAVGVGAIESPSLKLSDLRGKICVVTGANTGIGLRTATALAKCGGTVVFACRNETRARAAMALVRSECRNSEWGRVATLTFCELDLSLVRKRFSGAACHCTETTQKQLHCSCPPFQRFLR